MLEPPPIHVTANRTLHERWRMLGERVTRLNGIVQNDTDISTVQLAAWEYEVIEQLEAFGLLFVDTYNHVTGKPRYNVVLGGPKWRDGDEERGDEECGDE